MTFGESINFVEPPRPNNFVAIGNYVEIYPLLVSEHAQQLYTSFSVDTNNKIWDYLPYGPFYDFSAFEVWLKNCESSSDPYFVVFKSLSQNAFMGMASFLRIKPEAGSIEVGHINFSPLLQKTVAASEAMYLMMKWAFENGYRRYEWKCHALNVPSRKAAQRLGFSYEGISRQAKVVKGRNRDTVWFSVIDKEWLSLKECFQAFLQPANFDANGLQKISLSSLTKPKLSQVDPIFISR